MRKIIGLTIVLGLVLALLSSPMVAASTEAEEELLSLIAKYEQAFEAGDAEALGELYWHDEKLTVFWPEPETAFRIDGWNQWQSYLKTFAGFISQLPPGAFNLEIRQGSIVVIEDIAIATCHWIGTMRIPQGGSQVMQGRETMVWKEIEEEWVIIHEHTSLFPTP
jgi:ketosteroid isomerase-like protein